jgi:phosphoribosylformimino-5-aminoimidazole carboxamide ribotide isomerase
MIVIPAIDIKGGQCVRLLQGRKDQATVFSEDPAAMARRWEQEGASRIHVVDLDGAFEQKPQNLDSVRRIIEAVDIPIQLGGGIRDTQTIRVYLELGVRWVIIGTEAIRNPDLVHHACRQFPGQVMVGIDARKGQVAIEGWTQTTAVQAIDLAQQFEASGVAAIIFTDIQRDGMQTGVNLEATRQLAEAVSVPVIASGGVATLEDIRALLPLQTSGIQGVITGRALYSGALDLKAALALAKANASGEIRIDKPAHQV